MTTAMFAADIDWVASVQDWAAADELTGGVLATLFPLPGIVGQPIVSGREVLLAGKGAGDGTTSAVAVFDPGMLDESRLAASDGAAVAAKLSTGETAIGKKELLRDPGSREASSHPYASAMDLVRGGSVMCAAGRPSVLSTFLPAQVVAPISEASVVAVGLGRRELPDGRTAPTIRWFVPYQGLSPARQAAGAIAGV